jgi:hypothetical protein
MANPIGVVGFSGSGKSASLRNFDPNETVIVSPSKPSLPIPGFKKKYSKVTKEGGNFLMTKDLAKMSRFVTKVATDEKYAHVKYLVIDDTTHFFNAITLSPAFRARNNGNEAFARWADFGADIYQAFFLETEEWRDDLWIIMMFHPETYMTNKGERLKIKTPGTLLEREVDIPSYFVNMLYTHVEPVDKKSPQPPEERYKFVTNDDGYCPAKTDIGAFKDLYIENDLKMVLDTLDELANQE